MAQDQTKKEALFNEVKGSLFEYLVARKLSRMANEELAFQQGLDRNYQNVLSQQDRMVRQFYPEMLPFLDAVSTQTSSVIVEHLGLIPANARLLGKFTNFSLGEEIHEADLLVEVKGEGLPLSLKLNKKNAFVNTKSGGIKSFFQQYFPFLPTSIQDDFNQLVDLEFNRMSLELHEWQDLEYPGNFSSWVKAGLSELPGELEAEGRNILKRYYSRIAKEVHRILSDAQELNPQGFGRGLAPLMGYSSKEILQVVCFHDFKSSHQGEIHIHSYSEIEKDLNSADIMPFGDISSVEVRVGSWTLQIRVKPMNKFTTTAIKINCSVKQS